MRQITPERDRREVARYVVFTHRLATCYQLRGIATTHMPRFYGKKEIAQMLGCSVRNVERWIKRLKIPPTIPAWHGARWSEEDVDKIVAGLAVYWRRRGRKPMPKLAQ